ncbi:hypothetical protein AYO21_12067 [Fonsecaea monophora]|uniref:Uncharacterized protein n=1 Tax=Fonsecaea monophora TaxID=254056 RepID=A0A177EPC6_9EURO|nr:hypothetical protein AYO21_12067 [Fonsecaea monophora]OAG33833.1 hypothetical protein AYO21_12067 [Fonsecaea monophora]
MDTASQASVSMEISEPSTTRLSSRSSPVASIASSRRRRRSYTRSSTRSSILSSTAEPIFVAPLPATALAHFLATQLLSADPARTLLELTQNAPGAPPPLLEILRQRENHDEIPPPTDRLSLRAGLDHIQSHFPSDKQLPNVISNPSIERPNVVYTAEELQYLFTGYTCEADQHLRPHIDPLVDQMGDYTVTSEFDIDSLVLFSQHLGVFRQGILWYPSQMPLGALTTSMHMKPMLVQYYDSHGHFHQRRVPIHHIPNYCFARLPGADGFTAHWVFTRLYQPSSFSVAEKEGQRLTDRQFQHWTDRILLPSLRECLPAGRLHHLPASFKQAQANARALRTETRTAAVDAAVHHQNLQYEIPATYLPAIQEAIRRRAQAPGNHEFQDAYIIIVGKGLKLQPWKTASWATTIDCFFHWFERQFDPRHFSEDTVHVDIGKETLPPPSCSLLWREDFLRLFTACLQSLDPGSPRLTPTLYPWGFVHGVGSATLELPLECRLRDEGVSYIQHYSDFKEIFAAGNTYPFSNRGFSSLTLSPEVMATFQQIGGAIIVQPDVLARAFIHSKLRCHYGLWASATETFGNRWECRVTLRLLRQIDQCARRLSITLAPFTVTPTCSWVIHSTDILEEWYRFNLNKFCFGFETLYGRCQEKPYIAWEHTQLMILLLKCISCFAGVLIPGSREAIAQRQSRQGLGIGTNLQVYGYGWLADKIDWENWVLRPEVSGQFRVQNVSILETFRSHYRELRNHMDDYVLVASSVSLLSRWKESPIHVAFILRLFRAICLRAFQRDVFQILRPYVRPDYWADIVKGRIGLSADALHRVLDPERAATHLMVRPFQKIRNFHSLFQWLWGENDGFSRGPWRRLPYRMLYTFCGQVIMDIFGREYYPTWRRQFSKHVRINFWFLPYPSLKALISHECGNDQRRQFRWWSNYNYKLAQHHGVDANRVVRCHQWSRWPKGRWSVTPESDVMRGLPRPDFHLAFLRPEQVFEQLRRLEGHEVDTDADEMNEDEDGIDADGIRDEFGERRLPPEEHGGSSSELSVFDSDDSQLSEYQDRRRLRQEEKVHQRQRQRLGILRRSLRIEQQAFRQSIPHHDHRAMPGEEEEGEGHTAETSPHRDLAEMIRRYDERLAHLEEEQRQHAQAASQLSRRRSLGLRQARTRQRVQVEERRALEGRTRAAEEAQQRE